MGSEPTLRRVLLSAAAALVVGLGAVTLVLGFSDSPPLRVLQAIVVFAAGAVVIGGAVLLTLLHFAGWREPESEEEFELIVQRAERLAAEGYDPAGLDDGEDVSPYDDESDACALGSTLGEDQGEDFRALVRSRSTSCRSSSTARSSTSRLWSPTAGESAARTACTRATRSLTTISTTGS